jgi:alpha-N-arabinofuranosidase
MNVAIVNSDEEKSYTTKINGIAPGSEVQVFTVGGEAFKSADSNSEHAEKVNIRESVWNVTDTSYRFERLSFTLLRWKA